MSFLEVSALCAGYGDKKILQNISFSLEPGSITGILGANGSGKTTLLKALCGILPAEGNVLLEGQNLLKLSPRSLGKLCSYIPQRSGISIDLTVLDVVLMAYNPSLKLLEYPSDKMKQHAYRILTRAGLETLADRNFQTLSEGQKQSVIFARTLVSDAALLLLDEPESALDFGARGMQLESIRSHVHEHNASALVTLHDPELALNYCDHLLLLKGGQIYDRICPSSDPLRAIAEKMSTLYGPVEALRVNDQKGTQHLLLLRLQPDCQGELPL